MNGLNTTLAYGEIDFDRSTSLQTILTKRCDAEVGYMAEVNSINPNKKRNNFYIEINRSKVLDVPLNRDYIKSNEKRDPKPVKHFLCD